METYKPYFTKEFNDRIQKFKGLKKQVANKIGQLLKEPYRAGKSEKLLDNLKGLRSARVTRAIRIIYAICEECRRRGEEELAGCSSELCERMQDDAIIFLTLDVHEKVYKRKPKPD